MSTRHGGAGEGQGGEQPPSKRRRNRREGIGGAGQRDEAAAVRYFDCLSEDLIGDVLSFLGVRCLDSACHACKAVSQVAMRLMPLWIGVAASAGEGSADGGVPAASGLPAHVKPTLREALAAFQRFRLADVGGRGLEIRLVDNAQHATGFLRRTVFGDHVPGMIGCKDYRGLELDGEYHWQGLRVVTPDVDVLYDEASCYSVVVKDNVMSIGKTAFEDCKGLTSVTFPKGLTSIGSSAFYGCSGLTSVTLPEGLTSIGWMAFYGCSGLTSVTLPEGFTSIGEQAFHERTGLTSVTLPEGLTSIGDKAFLASGGLHLKTAQGSPR
eukprot:g4662.t1